MIIADWLPKSEKLNFIFDLGEKEKVIKNLNKLEIKN